MHLEALWLYMTKHSVVMRFKVYCRQEMGSGDSVKYNPTPPCTISTMNR